MTKLTREEVEQLVNEAREKGERPDLSRADLSRVDLSGIVLDQANFNQANLNRTDFSNANLSGAAPEANLNRAFEDKLGPQNPVDEPTSVLLEWILEAKAEKKKKRGRQL